MARTDVTNGRVMPDAMPTTSKLNRPVAQPGERFVYTEEVAGSIPVGSTMEIGTVIMLIAIWWLLFSD
jgi:hypothetical protein